MRFILLTILATYLWIYIFMKLVAEKPKYIYLGSEVVAGKENKEILLKFEVKTPAYLNNPYVNLWFTIFTYFVSDLWRCWIRVLLGMEPIMDEDDDEF